MATSVQAQAGVTSESRFNNRNIHHREAILTLYSLIGWHVPRYWLARGFISHGTAEDAASARRIIDASRMEVTEAHTQPTSSLVAQLESV